MTNEIKSQVILKQNEAYTGGFTILTLNEAAEIELGSLIIKWKRAEFINDFQKPFNELKLKLSQINIENRPFEIKITIKDMIEYGEILPMTINFRNKSEKNQKIQMCFLDYEGFLVSGDIKKIFDVKQNESINFAYNILSLGIGKRKLPGVQFICLSMENKLIWDSSGTRTVTVIPKINN